jgi:membrane protein implicated in regulation of membrane protease activity
MLCEIMCAQRYVRAVPDDDDPVLVQRARMAALATLGKRIGYLALAVACVAFVVGALSDLPGWSVAVVITGLALATATLVPAIILGYAVAKAEREDPGPQARRSGAVRG